MNDYLCTVVDRHGYFNQYVLSGGCEEAVRDYLESRDYYAIAIELVEPGYHIS